MGGLQAKPTDNLTQEEVKELEATFNLFDDDASGSISSDELGQVMRALGQDPTPEELEVMLHDVDTDGSGTIDVDEFINMMAKRSKGYEKEVKMAFKAFNVDGFISETELRMLFSTIKERVSDAQIAAMMHAAEPDDLGRISYKQFSALMKGILEVQDTSRNK